MFTKLFLYMVCGFIAVGVITLAWHLLTLGWQGFIILIAGIITVGFIFENL